jgi:hypothetical protein
MGWDLCLSNVIKNNLENNICAVALQFLNSVKLLSSAGVQCKRFVKIN